MRAAAACERYALPGSRARAAAAAVPAQCANLSVLVVLKSHFEFACIGLFKQLYRLCERRFVRTFDLQKLEGFSLSEAFNDGSGKEMVWVPKI
jgi:hypothetical protein